MTVMLNSGGRASVVFGTATRGYTKGGGGFTYNGSPYVHSLNRALQLETAAVTLYRRWLKTLAPNQGPFAVISDRVSSHQHASRELVRLIFAQRGLPDSEPSTFLAVTTTIAAKAAPWMPDSLAQAVLPRTATQLEASLVRRYRKILASPSTPRADAIVLQNLHDEARDFLAETL